MKNPVRDLLKKTDAAIEAEDAALQKRVANASLIGTEDYEPMFQDSPLPISNPEKVTFGVKATPPHWPDVAPSKKTVITSPKSPEDMEKEYISEAERAMKELTEARTENENDIAEYKSNIEASTANIVLINRLFAGHESFLKEALPVSKPKTPKETKAKT